MHPILARRALLALYFLAWLCVATLLAAVTAAGRGEWAAAAALALPLSLVFGFICLAVWYSCRANPLAGSGLARITLAHLGGAAFASGLWLAVGNLLAHLLTQLSEPAGPLARAGGLFARERALYFAVGLMLYLLSAALYYLLATYAEAQAAQGRALELKVSARDAELSALKAQIDPHFLFNSLNSVAALCGDDPAGARRMVLSLADFLRASRAAAARQEVPLAAELALARQYLGIEQVRFGERLKLVEEIDEAALAIPVPPLLLQPLVENAVRHGIAHRVEGGTVRIAATLDAARLHLAVENPFDAGRVASVNRRRREPGLGLVNVRERLRLTYGGAARLTVLGEGERFAVEVEVPRPAVAS